MVLELRLIGVEIYRGSYENDCYARSVISCVSFMIQRTNPMPYRYLIPYLLRESQTPYTLGYALGIITIGFYFFLHSNNTKYKSNLNVISMQTAKYDEILYLVFRTSPKILPTYASYLYTRLHCHMSFLA